ncbi:S26 family signal peptidase [Sphingomonas koreensis]|nr:S26 family signal peptidase [Sphingomonas koreensis]
MTRRSHSPSDTPLLAWGDALRARRARRRRLARRAGALAIGTALMAVTIVAPPAPRLVWNASASAPVGLYAVTPGATIAPGDMLIARLSQGYRRLAATRHYLPANVPLVKRAVGVAGDEICALGEQIFLNGTSVAVRQRADASGRTMPRWTGCIRLRGGQLFLLMADSPESFDGRYFGVTEASDVVGKARLLWSR